MPSCRPFGFTDRVRSAVRSRRPGIGGSAPILMTPWNSVSHRVANSCACAMKTSDTSEPVKTATVYES